MPNKVLCHVEVGGCERGGSRPCDCGSGRAVCSSRRHGPVAVDPACSLGQEAWPPPERAALDAQDRAMPRPLNYRENKQNRQVQKYWSNKVFVVWQIVTAHRLFYNPFIEPKVARDVEHGKR